LSRPEHALRPEASARGMTAAEVAARLEAAGLPAMPLAAGSGAAEEPVFHAPWEARVFALVIALVEAGCFPFAEFQNRLTKRLAAAEASGAARQATDTSGPAGVSRYYYECWLAAAEDTLIGSGLITADSVQRHIGELETHVREIREHQLVARRGVDAPPRGQG